MFGRCALLIMVALSPSLSACTQAGVRDQSAEMKREASARPVDLYISVFLSELLKNVRQTESLEIAAQRSHIEPGSSEISLKYDTVVNIDYSPRTSIQIISQNQCLSPDGIAITIEQAGYERGRFTPANYMTEGPRKVIFQFVSTDGVSRLVAMIFASDRDCVSSIVIQ